MTLQSLPLPGFLDRGEGAEWIGQIGEVVPAPGVSSGSSVPIIPKIGEVIPVCSGSSQSPRFLPDSNLDLAPKSLRLQITFHPRSGRKLRVDTNRGEIGNRGINWSVQVSDPREKSGRNRECWGDQSNPHRVASGIRSSEVNMPLDSSHILHSVRIYLPIM